MRVFPVFTRGSHCPHCRSRTDRIPTPTLLRPVRWLFPSVRRRRCVSRQCGWRGFASPSVQPAHSASAGRGDGVAAAR